MTTGAGSQLSVAVAVPVVAGLVSAGHSSITVTFDTYGHLFPDPENDQAAFEEIEAGVLGL